MEQPTADLNCTNINGYTALHVAANVDNVEAVKLLLADPRLNSANQKNNDGKTAVMMAIISKSVNTLRELVAHPSVDLDTYWEGMSLEEVVRWDFLHFFHFIFASFTTLSLDTFSDDFPEGGRLVVEERQRRVRRLAEERKQSEADGKVIDAQEVNFSIFGDTKGKVISVAGE